MFHVCTSVFGLCLHAPLYKSLLPSLHLSALAVPLFLSKAMVS